MHHMENLKRPDVKIVLAKNVDALMKRGKGPSTQIDLGQKAGIGQSGVRRILGLEENKNGPTLSNIDATAAAYGLATWQLLVPDLDPDNIPSLSSMHPEHRALVDTLLSAAKALADYERRQR